MGTQATKAILFASAVFLVGCGWTRPRPSLTSNDPADQIPAMKTAAQQHDEADIAILVKDLESDDSALRFYAIESLQRLTGQDLGYVYYADDQTRAEAVARWKAWLMGRTSATQAAVPTAK